MEEKPHFNLGVLLILFTIIDGVVGFTVFPLLGAIIALVLFILAEYFNQVYLNESCETCE